VTLRYDLGSDHPLVGRSVPDFELADGTRLNERLRSGKGLLLDFDPCAPLQGFANFGDRVEYVGGNTSNVNDRLGSRALLVRPDGIVAWATEEEAALNDVICNVSRWFGEA
jgi:hypothetical protein